MVGGDIVVVAAAALRDVDADSVLGRSQRVSLADGVRLRESRYAVNSCDTHQCRNSDRLAARVSYAHLAVLKHPGDRLPHWTVRRAMVHPSSADGRTWLGTRQRRSATVECEGQCARRREESRGSPSRRSAPRSAAVQIVEARHWVFVERDDDVAVAEAGGPGRTVGLDAR